MPLSTYVCPTCGDRKEKYAISGSQVGHACPKAKIGKKFIQYVEEKES